MLRALLIAPDAELRQGAETLFAATGQILLLKTFTRYLSFDELMSEVRAHSPQVVFLDIYAQPQMIKVAAQLAKAAPAVFPVALHRGGDPQTLPQLLMELMHLGIREFLAPPFARGPFLQSIARLAEAVRETPAAATETDLVYSFLPAKPGVGASTLALNISLSLARLFESKVLLTDFDLDCGIARFLLKLTNPFSVYDALEKAGELDSTLWSGLVSEVEKLDVLASGAIQPSFHAEPSAIRRVFDFARRHYRAVGIDLSGGMDQATIELLGQSRRILLVVQPELAAVFLAREKLRFLRSLDLEDRVSVILNRYRRDAVLSIADIESVVGLPVQHTFPDDPKAVYQAVLNGGGVDPATELGREFLEFAQTLAEQPGGKQVTPKKRMVEYFSLLPARYTLFSEPRT